MVSESNVYSPKDIQMLLNLKRSTLYELLNEAYLTGKPFRVIKIGKLYRIERKSFDGWVNG